MDSGLLMVRVRLAFIEFVGKLTPRNVAEAMGLFTHCRYRLNCCQYIFNEIVPMNARKAQQGRSKDRSILLEEQGKASFLQVHQRRQGYNLEWMGRN